MSAIRSDAIAKLRACREALVAIPKDQLMGPMLFQWYLQWEDAITRSDHLTELYLKVKIHQICLTFRNEHDTDVMCEVTTDVVSNIDRSLELLDTEEPVRPILDTYIALVADTKLATYSESSMPSVSACGARLLDLAWSDFPVGIIAE